jgi:Na+-driven multidrug efflux pump
MSLISVMYFDGGIAGLWYGPTFATFYNTAIYTWLIQKIQWQSLIDQARERRARD